MHWAAMTNPLKPITYIKLISYNFLEMKKLVLNFYLMKDYWTLEIVQWVQCAPDPHLTANHSYYFVHPVTSIHTNTIESQWWSLRRRLSSNGIQKIDMDVYNFHISVEKGLQEPQDKPFPRIHWRYSESVHHGLKQGKKCSVFCIYFQFKS